MTRALTGATRVAGIIGDPVGHSRSPVIWNAAFAAADVDWVFVALPVPAGGAAVALDGMRALGIAALTVTMPHKADAAGACDQLSETATRLAAVNAITNADSRLMGDSTDGEGFVRSVADHGVDPSGRRCLVLGAGGAARAIALALGDIGAEVVVAARRIGAAQAAASLASGGRGVSFDAVNDEVSSADVIVNATPLGMDGEAPPFDVELLRRDAVVAETVYHPIETPLLARARARELLCIGGVGMLVHQAAISFRAFTGIDAPLDVMHAAAARTS
ncbi:MAG: shikimate dehydrogenase [Acidimicrobiia bacterium]